MVRLLDANGREGLLAAIQGQFDMIRISETFGYGARNSSGVRLKTHLALFTIAIALAPPAWAADPTGTWLTQPGSSRIRIADCGGALCGTIVWLKEPNDAETGKPKLDKLNSDPAKRSHSLMGTAIVIGMKPSGTEKWSGQVYNAEDGKTYTGSITLQGANALKLEGCALGGLICKAQTWTRVN